MQNYVGLIGIAAIFAVTYAWSDNRRAISWRLVITGTLLAFGLGVLLLKVPGTSDMAFAAGTALTKIADYAMKGAEFAFGPTLTWGTFQAGGPPQFIFAIRIGVTIFVVCGLCTIGYYIGLLQLVVRFVGFCLRRTLGLSGAEAFSCAASAWVGQVEAQMLIKPYLAKLTRSELFCSMTNSMAVAAGSALILYMSMGVHGQYLITASLMSSLTSIVLAKMKMPETEPEKIQDNVEIQVDKHGGFFDSVERGVMHGARIAFGVVVMVIFAVAFMAMATAAAEAILPTFGIHAPLLDILAQPLRPLAYLMGIPWSETMHAGRWIATELLYNEAVSYSDMVAAIAKGEVTPRTEILMTCALCGFAHLGSIGIQIGGLATMAPERRSEIAANAWRAMIIANLATWLSAALCSLIV